MSDFEDIERLFHLTMAQAAPDRLVFLRAQTDNEVLYQEVLSLVKSAEGQTISSSLKDAASTIYQNIEDNYIGVELGNYRLLERIGSGGMGTVYLAERSDGSFTKQFAVKIVKKGMDTEHIIQRFKVEREILARLSHPNIAILFDGGITDDGRPWFVMEYVKGESIDVYCDNKNLTVPQRIQLFRIICNAVHHAHQNLVVHRDLKPSNVLVTDNGTVKLLDFGIAKLIDQDETQIELTQTNMALFTPAYAAPEQMSNSKLVSTSIDIYALGVILYQLLTGRRPFVASRTAEEFKQQVLSSDITKPSTVITRQVLIDNEENKGEKDVREICDARATGLSSLQKALKGDLDTICLMALRPEPEKRYLSAEQLAADLDRHLNLQPIIARPDSFAYRFNRLVKRHKWGFATAAVSLAVFLATVTFYTQQLKNERDFALSEQEKTREVTEFVTKLFYSSDPMEGGHGSLSAREILDEGATRLKNDLEKRPEIYAKLSSVLGQIYYQLGEHETAKKFFNEAKEKQLSLYGSHSAQSIETDLGLGYAIQRDGDFPESRKLYETALHSAKIHYGEIHSAVHEALLALAFLDETEGKYPEAENYFQQALAVAEKLPKGSRAIPIAKTKSQLAELYKFQDRLSEAEMLLREALEIQEKELGVEHLETLTTKRILAGILREAHKYEESDELYKVIIEARTRILGEDHIEVIHTWNSYSQLLNAMGNKQGALDAISKAIDIIERNRSGPNTSLPAMYYNRAYYKSSLELYDEAIADFDKSVEMQAEVGLPEDHPDRAYPIAQTGSLYMSIGRWQEAKPRLLKALNLRLKHFEPDHRLVMPLYNNLGKTCTKLGEYAEAEKYLLTVLQPNIDRYGIEHNESQASIENLAALYKAQGKTEQQKHYEDMLIDIDQ